MGRFASQCEFVLWGTAGAALDLEEVGCLWGVIRKAVTQSDKFHQTGKSVEVMRALVKICRPGGLVLDPFAGSGTTGVAALIEGRSFFGVELVSAIREKAEQRLRAAEIGTTLSRRVVIPRKRKVAP